MHSVVDERSAAYMALGMAMETRKPAILLCTSGTAVLNYAPAVAEAFFQKVPLLILTADRPADWIGHQDNQAIYQDEVFGKNCHKSYSLPCEPADSRQLDEVHQILCNAYFDAINGEGGPVHINIPIDEPLYIEIPEAGKLAYNPEDVSKTDEYQLANLTSAWEKTKHKMIVMGQMPPNASIESQIERLSDDSSVVVIAEPIANQRKGNYIAPTEAFFARLAALNKQMPSPELVLYFGGQVVSKSLKAYLRNLTDCRFVYVSPNEFTVDTFRQQPIHMKAGIATVLKKLTVTTGGIFQSTWMQFANEVKECVAREMVTLEFSDLKVAHFLTKALPPSAKIFVGNSSIIRYLQNFEIKQQLYANRGTSGIDGCLSTAVGLAKNSSGPVFAILGDVSFLYDTNAFLQGNLPANLKIIVVNNGGGGIFRLLPGPSSIPGLLPMQETSHKVRIGSLCQAYGVNYFFCNSIACLDEELEWLLKASSISLLEIKTPMETNPEVFTMFNQKLKE